jgi:hypothetical protein
MAARLALFIAGILLLAAGALPLAGQEADPSEFVIDGFRLATQPGGHYFSNFIENLAPDAVWLTEESNGFGLLDRPRVYFEGDSWTQFSWRYAGHAIDSALADGAPALQLPFLAIGALSLQGETPRRMEYGFVFSPRPPAEPGTATRVMLSSALPNLGGWTALGKLAVANHPSLRADRLYESRRRLDGNFQLDFSLEKGGRRSSLLLAGGYVSQQRRFNDFNERDSQFEEDGGLLQLLGRWQRRWSRGTLDLDLVVNAGGRGNLLAENGRYPQETYDLEKRSWLAAASWSGGASRLKLSWLHERQEILPAFPAAGGKDLLDVDGQAFFPFEKWGEASAETLAASAWRRFALTWRGRSVVLEPFLDAKAVFQAANERTDAAAAILFSGQPYLVRLGTGGGEYRNQRRTVTAGALLGMELGRRLSLHARLFLQYQGLAFKDPASGLDFLQPGGEAGLSVQAGRRTSMSLSYGDLPYEMRAGVADFLEGQRPGAEIRYWTDANFDGRFQEGEQGPLYALSGGASHSAAGDLQPSRRRRLELFFTTPVSRRLRLDIKGLYKWIRRPLWVRFAEEYGHFQEEDGKSYYLLDRPVSAYELGNAAFAKEPFYAQFLLRIHGERERRWYFSFSFLAHIGMGTTAFGNGPEDNDVGVISESQAFPNSWVNGFGRVDGDRAFVGKVAFGRRLARRLFLAGSVKYRDGNPFAFIDAVQRGGQWVITYQTIKAEDEHGRKGGPREDCIWDFNFKLGYDIGLFGKKGRLELSLFNLLDFGGELSEYAFSGGARLANELQLPRSLRLGIVLEL